MFFPIEIYLLGITTVVGILLMTDDDRYANLISMILFIVSLGLVFNPIYVVDTGGILSIQILPFNQPFYQIMIPVYFMLIFISGIRMSEQYIRELISKT